ncbi:isopentenyl-diphosphate delta-isomerase [Serinicoccus sp. CUA-874]|uniref:isopentenyl-diphosphate Delta-isomerase n=1 Tax=Serinicoccus sp. CUA-874 TaxID=1517939 RepID=UPI00095BC891|nr:isopentenyl-diphosphate Delta-isomerase [Serinicoccus sp. CUA-874]OLT17865.1 isopentenyl-diphosphate delta-isomerase [Serinicoccus sp. CUA-874]
MTDVVQDLVVLVDEDGRALGTAPRQDVHTATTPRHRAFSLYLFDERGRVLLTRRALSKRTWPGVWTNACCGHPRPDEPDGAAVRRRLQEELGVDVTDLQLALPTFAYRATDASGIVENEVCPVFAGRVSGELLPDPAEVAEHLWVEWDDLVAGVRALPGVYSPWAAEQVPLLESERLRLPLRPGSSTDARATGGAEARGTLDRVEALIGDECSWTDQMWSTLAPSGPVDLIADEPGDLPSWLRAVLTHGGKRLRPRMGHWGFVAAGGRLGSRCHDDLVRAAAALEMLHAFALIHDDVMDQSSTRRGAPAAHVVAAKRHRQGGGQGRAERFGENIAILLGDLAHSLADRLVNPLPSTMRDYWYELNLELIAGQRGDLTGSAAGRRDLAHAEAVAALKSGAYTIERPLQLGSLAAVADGEQREALSAYGRHLGRAFAWRDDILGVWGEPERTGKPSGDDLREGKTTLIWVLGSERLTGAAADAMARVGTDQARAEDVAVLQDALESAGVRQDLETRIREEVEAAEAALRPGLLTEEGIAGLRDEARAIAWRDA